MAPSRPIYLDHQATTPLDPVVLEAMMPYLTEHFGNASSVTHRYGLFAEAAVERARRQVAELLGAEPREIVFTSGATEANNLALRGTLEACTTGTPHVVSVTTEHKSVLDPLKHLAARGAASLTLLEVDRRGVFSVEALERALRPTTALVAVMLANNEIGTVADVQAVGRLCEEKGIAFHCDAVQGAGRVPFDVRAARVSFACLSAHKLYGPKGVGALFVRARPRAALVPLLHGGGQERGLRAGTLNVPGIVGLGAACARMLECGRAEGERLRGLRDRLRERITGALEGVHVNGAPERSLDGLLSLSFEGADAEGLLMSLRELALSAGSACTSASPEPSHVLTACGLPRALARGTLRFGVGRFNTQDEIDYAVEEVVTRVHQQRKAIGYERVRQEHHDRAERG